MTIAFSSGVYTAVGAYASGTLSSASLSGFVTPSSISNTKNRGIQIVSGMGVGQVRNIASTGGINHTIDAPWTIVPDNTSQFLISHLEDEAYTVSGTNLIKLHTANSAANGDSEQRSAWQLTGQFVVGDSTTPTFLKIMGSSWLCTFVPNANSYAFQVKNNALLLWGDLEPNNLLSYNSGTFLMGSARANGDAYLSWFFKFDSGAKGYFYGIDIRPLTTENITDQENYYYPIHADAGSEIKFINSGTKGRSSLELLTTNVDLRQSKVAKVIPGNGLTYNDVAFEAINSKAFESTGGNPNQTYRLVNCRFRVFFTNGDLRAGEVAVRSGSTIDLVNPDWTRHVGWVGTQAQTFSNGAKIREFFTYQAICRDASNALVGGVSVLLFPTAGADTTAYTATTLSSGTFTPIEVKTGQWDSQPAGGYPNPITYSYSNFLFAARLRKYGYQFLEFPLTLNTAIIQTPTIQVDAFVTGSKAIADEIAGIAFNSATTAITITASVTVQQLYNKITAYLIDNMAIAPFAVFDGSTLGLSWNLTIDTGGNLTGAGQRVNMPTKTLTLSGTGETSVPITDLSGTRVQITAPNLAAGTRVRIYNITDSTEIDNSLVSGGSGYKFNFTHTTDKTIQLKAILVNGATAKEFIVATAILSNNGATFLNAQADNIFYNEIAIDGSTVTEFTADYASIQIDVDDADGVTSLQRAYAWYIYTMSTANGIRNYNNNLQPQGDIYNYLVVDAVNNPLQVQNVGSLPVRVTGGIIKRDDGVSVIAPVTNSIVVEPDRVYSGPLPNAQATQLASIDTRTARVNALIENSGGDRFTTKALETVSKNGYALSTAGNDAVAAAVDLTLLENFAAIANAIGNLPSLTQIEGSSVLAKNSVVLNLQAAVADLKDLRGYTLGNPVTVNKLTGTITTQDGKSVIVSDLGDTRTITRTA